MSKLKDFDHIYSEVQEKVHPDLFVYPFPTILEPILELIAVVSILNEGIQKFQMEPEHDAEYVIKFQESKIQKIKSVLSEPSVQELLNLENFAEETCLHYAVARDNCDVDVLDELLNLGANPNKQNKGGATPLHLCVRSNQSPKVMEVLLKHGGIPNIQNIHRDTPLHIAARKPNKNEIVRTLLENGAEIQILNYKHRNILHTAFENDEMNLWLIQKCLEMQPSLVNSFDLNKLTPLHFIMRNNWENKLPVVELLLNSNADVRATDIEQKTPLHCMQYDFNESEYNVIQYFISKGADINAKDLLGRTPLFYALHNRCYEIARELILMGAKINVLDKQNKSILCEAVDVLERGDNLIFNYLKVMEGTSKGLTLQRVINGQPYSFKILLTQSPETKPERGITHISLPDGLVCVNNEKQFQLIQLLLENGADPDTGNVPYHLIPFDFGVFSSEKLLLQYKIIKNFVAALSQDQIKNAESVVKENVKFISQAYDYAYREDWIHYRDAAILEVTKMIKDKLSKNLSVFKFVAERCSTGSPPIQTNFHIIDEYLLRLNSDNYPNCQDIMFTAIKRSDLEWRLHFLGIYTPRSVDSCNKDSVFLCSLALSHVMKYLSKYDLVNLALAYHPKPLSVKPTTLKRRVPCNLTTSCCKRFKVNNNLSKLKRQIFNSMEQQFNPI